MADLTDLQKSDVVRLVGGDEAYAADVVLQDGIKRLATNSIVTVEEVFGRDPQATVWLYLNTQYDVGNVSLNDTVRIQIAAGANVSLYPAVDVTTTADASVIAASNKEVALADKIVSDLNANGNFSLNWKAQRIKDFSGVFISSKLFNEWGERKTAGDFTVTTTGTVTAIAAYDKIERRGSPTELNRSPNDPRQGILNIAGSVFFRPGLISDLFEEDALNAGSNALNVSGTLGTPVIFSIGTDATMDKVVNDLRFHGRGNGIKFGQFLNINTKLTNGILIEIKSDNKVVTFGPYKSTDDLKSRWGSLQGFDLAVQAGGDHFHAAFKLDTPFVLRKTGTFATNDYIKVYIRDNITTVAELFFTIDGFKQEP